MFYSHTFLARKGPLGTVWCAAHLQHRLTRRHYLSTDIPSTVERIISPEVPIALRMSGHLLLGVVRIHLEKIKYLLEDFKNLQILMNALENVDVNSPKNARQAKFNAITLPETYALDNLDIVNELSLLEGSQNNHLRNQEEITLTNKYAAETELYVRITFEDDILPNSSHLAGSPQRERESMQIDSPYKVPSPIRNVSPNIDEERHGRLEGESFFPYEVMRDRDDNDFHFPSPILRPHSEDVVSMPNISPPKDTAEKETDTPLSVDIVTSHLQPRQSPQRSGPSSPSPSGAHVVSDSFVNAASTDLVLRPTPSPERHPPPRQRRKRQFFDEILVLTNEFYRKALDDPSDLVKKRKKLPSSDLEMMKFKEKKRKEQILSKPLISGTCVSLQNLLSKDLISLDPNLILSDEAQPELRATNSHVPISNVGEETERLRSPVHDHGHNFQQMFPSSPPLTPPQSHGNSLTLSSPIIPSTVSEPRFASTVNTQSDSRIFTRSTALEMDTPMMDFEQMNDNSSTVLSDIPEWRISAEPDELSFLEQDNNNLPESQQVHDGGTMSVRTRAVAQYLKKHSSLSNIDGPSEHLSLGTILEGRRRNLCARMLYETLVLKNCGKIDVQQDKAYGDIILKLNPLSKAKN